MPLRTFYLRNFAIVERKTHVAAVSVPHSVTTYGGALHLCDHTAERHASGGVRDCRAAASRRKGIPELHFLGCAVRFFYYFSVSLHKTGRTRELKNKLLFHSFALSLHKTGRTRELKNKLLFRSFALSLHKTGRTRKPDKNLTATHASHNHTVRRRRG